LTAGVFGVACILIAFYSCGHVAMALERKSESALKSQTTEKQE